MHLQQGMVAVQCWRATRYCTCVQSVFDVEKQSHAGTMWNAKPGAVMRDNKLVLQARGRLLQVTCVRSCA